MHPKPLETEPWVDIPNARALGDWQPADEIATNQKFRQAEKYRFYINTFDFLKDNAIYGNYLEFGVHRVRTFRMALTEARKHAFDQMRFFAFDSFEGLPEVTTDPSTPMWKKGALCTSEELFWSIIREHGIYTDKVKTVRGYYERSLTPVVQEEVRRLGGASMICVDCDLYESAVSVFPFCEGVLQEGTVLYLDDYFAGYRGNPTKGVARAFAEFCERSDWKFQPHLSIGWWGRSFIAYK